MVADATGAGLIVIGVIEIPLPSPLRFSYEARDDSRLSFVIAAGTCLTAATEGHLYFCFSLSVSSASNLLAHMTA